MKAIVLAAGYATRLYPLTKDTPKPLLEVDGLSILDQIRTRLSFLDIDEAAVVTNAKFYPHFQKWAQGVKAGGPKVTVINDGTDTEATRRGSMGDVHFCLKQTGWKEGFLLINGDNLCTFSFAPAMNTFRAKGHTILTYDVGSREAAKLYGVPVVEETGLVSDFVEKPANPQSSLVSIGVYFYGPETPVLLDEFVRTAPSVDKTGDFVGWLARKSKVYAHAVRSTDGLWFDIGTLDQLEEARQTITDLHLRPYPNAAAFRSAVAGAVAHQVAAEGARFSGAADRVQSGQSFMDLVRLLGHNDPNVRVLTLRVLGDLGIAAASSWLLDSAFGSRTGEKDESLKALVKLGYAPTLEAAVAKALAAGYR